MSHLLLGLGFSFSFLATIGAGESDLTTDDLRTDENGVRRRGTIQVDIATNQKSFVAGEKMVVSVTVSEDCYLRLLYVSAAGELVEIFPNDEKDDYRIAGGKTVQVPDAEDTFDFVMSGPFGKERLKAIVCSRPFELKDLENADVEALIWASAKPAVTKGMIVQKREKTGQHAQPPSADFRFGEATLRYEVYPK